MFKTLELNLDEILKLRKRYLKEYQIKKSINKLKEEIIEFSTYIDKNIRFKSSYYTESYLFEMVLKIIFDKLNINKDYNYIRESLFKDSINYKIIKKSKIKEIGYKPNIYDTIFQNGQFHSSLIWRYRRKEILKRDKNNCLLCFKEKIIKKAKIVHHIFSLLYYPEICMDPFNLISLCNEHHEKIYELYPISLDLIREKEIIFKNLFNFFRFVSLVLLIPKTQFQKNSSPIQNI